MLNMWFDADIDAVMTRTAGRPIPSGKISREEALAFGLFVAVGAIVVLALALNVTAAALLAFAIFFYVVVYTMWLKRRTPQNIVIGGAAGALPPVIGWAAATGEIGLEPFILFLIIFLWTPPHFWALSLARAHEYSRAGIPCSHRAGRAATTRRSVCTVGFCCHLFAAVGTRFAGALYVAVAMVPGAILAALARRLHKSAATNRQAAHRLFVFSISYLFLLFAALLASSGDVRPRVISSISALPDTGSAREFLPRSPASAWGSSGIDAEEA